MRGIDGAGHGRGGASGFIAVNWGEDDIFQGGVGCLSVDGRRAVVGSAGLRFRRVGGRQEPLGPGTLLVLVVDGAYATEDRVAFVRGEGTTTPDCTTASFPEPAPAGPYLIVDDAR